jgi:hypothetical protein
LVASREASLRFAAGPPPFSTALLAACIRKSLSSAKSAGVRIYGRGGYIRSDGSLRIALPLHTFVVASVEVRFTSPADPSSFRSLSPFFPSSSSLSLTSRRSSPSLSTSIQRPESDESSDDSDSISQPSHASSSSSPSPSPGASSSPRVVLK